MLVDTSNSKIFHVRIARTRLGDLIVIDSDEDEYREPITSTFAFTDVFDTGHVIYGDDETAYPVFQGVDLIPKERGVYVCEIEAKTWQSNHPLDPVEWDTRMTINSVIPLENK